QREREIGIRLALGADPSDVRRLVLGQGVRLIVSGMIVGLIVAAIATRLIARVVVLVSVTDPIAFGVMTALLGAVALVACYLPARRATKVDPMVALRHE